MSNPCSRREAVRQLDVLGLERGSIVVVHTAFSSVGPIEGGPEGLIMALLEAIGTDGTLVMPSMTDDDDHVFDAGTTPCRGLGVVADTFWRMPGVLRSDNPHAFAALGRRAREITAPHPVDVPHGPDSPIGRVHEQDGQVLLLGVGHDSNTTVHLAENLAGVRYRRPKHVTIERGGLAMRYEYDEIDHCCESFAHLDAWLDARGSQRRGRVGHGDARLMRSRDVVSEVVPRLRKQETLFLHPPHVCGQCREAWAAIPPV